MFFSGIKPKHALDCLHVGLWVQCNSVCTDIHLYKHTCCFDVGCMFSKAKEYFSYVLVFKGDQYLIFSFQCMFRKRQYEKDILCVLRFNATYIFSLS